MYSYDSFFNRPVPDEEPFCFYDLPGPIQQAMLHGFCSIFPDEVMHYRPVFISIAFKMRISNGSF